MLAQHDKLETIVMKDTIYSISFVLFFILATHWHFQGTWMDDLHKMAISICSVIVFLNFSRKIKMYGVISNMFKLFGRESLAIYVMQFYLCRFCVASAFQTTNPFILFVIAFVTAVPICYICSWTSIMIKGNPYLAFVLLGKRRNCKT